MREILFRGKRLGNGEWVEGYYAKCQEPINHGIGYILPKVKSLEFGNIICIGGFIEVKPETVGQYTGLTDRNGKRIFEGDIIRHDGRMGAIQYYENFGMFMIYWIGGNGANMFVNIPHTEVEIIGNIHDNPELID